MKRKLLLLLLVAVSVVGQTIAQNPATTSARDSVVYQATFYFQSGIGQWIKQSDYSKMSRLLSWAKSDTTTPIEITGWADRTGTVEQNDAISLNRARFIRNYLVSNGISSDRITFKGQSVDTQAGNNDKARRADVVGIIRMAVEAKPQTKPAVTPEAEQPKQEVVAEPVVEQPKQEVVAEPTPEQKQEIDRKIEQDFERRQERPVQRVIVDPTSLPAKTQSINNHRWYVGIEGGISLGVSNFSSFTPRGGTGLIGSVFGGYRFSPLLSAEVGVSIGKQKLGTNKCCEDYFFGADGMRYFDNVVGMDSYSYKDIHSAISMQQYALRLNVDMMQIVNANWDKRWSLALSPAIYGINSKATLRTTHTIITKRNSQFQFGAGIGIGAGFQINKHLGVGLRSGVLWVFGDQFDGVPQPEHNDNLIWNNTVLLTWRF